MFRVTEVAFHFNVPDRLLHACRYLRKAHAASALAFVVSDAQTLQQLDDALWTFSATDFIPHAVVSPVKAPGLELPVALGEDVASATHGQILLNLGQAVVPGFERFERLVEIVGLHVDERAAGRARWKHYADRGYAITSHDFAQKSGAA